MDAPVRDPHLDRGDRPTPMLDRPNPSHASRFAPADRPVCPLCLGPMWDNRATKRSPSAPDFKCRNRTCGGRLWPTRVDSIAATLERRQADGTLPIRGAAPRAETAPETATSPAAAPAVRPAVDSPADMARAHFRTRAALRACYATATDFVLSQIVPRYAAAGLTVSDQAVAQIVATLFAATCAQGALAGSVPRADAAHLAAGDDA